MLLRGEGQLVQVARALIAACLLARRLHRWNQKRDQPANDRDDDQQLDQGERSSTWEVMPVHGSSRRKAA